MSNLVHLGLVIGLYLLVQSDYGVYGQDPPGRKYIKRSEDSDHSLTSSESNRPISEIGGHHQAGSSLPLPGDCAEVFANGNTESGVYTIYLTPIPSQDTVKKPISVYCDMATDGGGWLVFQRRQNGALNFKKTWADYALGFGKLRKEFWLGNDILHELTRNEACRLRIDLEDHDGNKRHAEYQKFSVDSESNHFQLSFQGYDGNAGDSLAYHNGNYFTTFDRDNDKNSGNCAVKEGGDGGWWFNNCHYSNLNGAYGNNRDHQGVNWYHWRGSTYSLKVSEMKIKPM